MVWYLDRRIILFALVPNIETIKRHIEIFGKMAKWNAQNLTSKLPDNLVLLASSQYFEELLLDTPCWKPTPHGLLTISLAWEVHRKIRQKNNMFSCLWNRCFTPSIGDYLEDGYLLIM